MWKNIQTIIIRRRYLCFAVRPEGPSESSPGRQAGVRVLPTNERQRRGTGVAEVSRLRRSSAFSHLMLIRLFQLTPICCGQEFSSKPRPLRIQPRECSCAHCTEACPASEGSSQAQLGARREPPTASPGADDAFSAARSRLTTTYSTMLKQPDKHEPSNPGLTGAYALSALRA